ncbi:MULTISPECIES: type III-B CRISPR-associated protein Cas10/Cmr2 [Methylomicrobium]|uniref:CRISPR-associated protein Cas10/Cmr2, subtype III-B n=1 Tax=Methylomicrobium album BG8 TaxID=686340 RepID=H8GGS1_METAL|nr:MULTISPECIES: type III-B CRISPR-associated protein Cas10/Cmr2 [Methylomicrobium]EIC30034.1 CRISPR-associated protein Cas10/Cmr2, subtype III-B [Methylomicrobium album BG8]
MKDNTLWQAKLAARVHDPAEKALVLMRDPAGHEGGTTRALFKTFFPNGLDAETKAWIEKSDHWASAADRPQFPQDKDNRYAAWAQVRFDQAPEIKHPLTGDSAELMGKLNIDPAHIKAFSTDYFLELIERDAQDAIDWQKTLLGFWRFGPELNPKGIGHLWRLLPADTRVPDHTIWAHLDLTSAFCGAFAADPNEQPALLNVSFGPVQSFIAAGRSTSDLWAGSHLLSRIAWEGMKIICERLGPDAIIFPQLRGVPLVDLWLQKDMGLPASRFDEFECEWRKAKTDANPLFSAALPNKFLALVPASMAMELAEQVTARVRQWVLAEANAMLDECLEIARLKQTDLYCYRQLKEQLNGFPEVYWAAVPWLCRQQEGKVNIDALQEAMLPFYPETNLPGFLGSELWKTLNQAIQPEQDWQFYRPNPGVLYPAVYDLLDRVAAAAKATRTFQQKPQQGYRNTLSGEYEWLTTNQTQLAVPPGKRQNTLWQKVAEQKPSWVKNGEHLSALDMLKRLWPKRFIDEIKNSVDGLGSISRYVVSTHDMAFSTSFEQWLQNSNRESLPIELMAILEGWSEQSALPKKVLNMTGADQQARLLAKKLPSFWDAHCENETLKPSIKFKLSGFFQETYYALILMDGDNMGAWLSGSEDKYRLAYQDSWHSKIKSGIDQRYREQLKSYLESKRYPSPARHMAISDALNGFSLDLARYVVEDLYKGKLLYAGGDDVMAMVSVDDLLPAMLLLRLVYSGIFPVNGDSSIVWKSLLKQEKAELRLKNGYVLKDETLYRVMGVKATASCGAVIAHHAAPLGQVLKTLRSAEQRAKKTGGRDAFAIDLLKRSGGAVKLTCPWFNNPDNPESLLDSPMGQLIRMRDALAEPNLSRRAAYIAQDWLRQLPPQTLFLQDPFLYKSLLQQSLEYPLLRQNQGIPQYHDLAERMVELGMSQAGQACADFITHFIGIAEFLARDSRAGGAQ